MNCLRTFECEYKDWSDIRYYNGALVRIICPAWTAPAAIRDGYQRYKVQVVDIGEFRSECLYDTFFAYLKELS